MSDVTNSEHVILCNEGMDNKQSKDRQITEIR